MFQSLKHNFISFPPKSAARSDKNRTDVRMDGQSNPVAVASRLKRELMEAKLPYDPVCPSLG